MILRSLVNSICSKIENIGKGSLKNLTVNPGNIGNKLSKSIHSK